MRAHLNTEAKRAIAASVAEQLTDGQTLILDGGTTGTAIAEAIAGRDLTVCALNLRVAEILVAAPDTRVMVPGGFIRSGGRAHPRRSPVRHLRDDGLRDRRHHRDDRVERR